MVLVFEMALSSIVSRLNTLISPLRSFLIDGRIDDESFVQDKLFEKL